MQYEWKLFVNILEKVHRVYFRELIKQPVYGRGRRASCQQQEFTDFATRISSSERLSIKDVSQFQRAIYANFRVDIHSCTSCARGEDVRSGLTE